MIRFISLSVVTMGLLCGNAAFAGPTGWAHKDDPNTHPWLRGYSHSTPSHRSRPTTTHRQAPAAVRYNLRREGGYTRWNDARGVHYLKDGLNRTFYWNGQTWTYAGY